MSAGVHGQRTYSAQAVEEVDLGVAGGRRLGVVGGEHDRRAPVGLGPQQVQHALAVLGVELAGDLVGQQHVAAQGEAAGQRGALLLAAGELLDQLVGLVGQAQPVQRLDGTAAGLRRLDAAGDQRDLDVLAGGQDRGEPVVLRHQHDLLGHRVVPVAQGDAVDRDRAADRPDQPGHGPQQRGLAGARRPGDREHPARHGVHRDVAQHDVAVVRDRDRHCQRLAHVHLYSPGSEAGRGRNRGRSDGASANGCTSGAVTSLAVAVGAPLGRTPAGSSRAVPSGSKDPDQGARREHSSTSAAGGSSRPGRRPRSPRPSGPRRRPGRRGW